MTNPIIIDSAYLIVEFRAEDDEISDANLFTQAASWLRSRDGINECVVATQLESIPDCDGEPGDATAVLRLVLVPVPEIAG